MKMRFDALVGILHYALSPSTLRIHKHIYEPGTVWISDGHQSNLSDSLIYNFRTKSLQYISRGWLGLLMECKLQQGLFYTSILKDMRDFVDMIPPDKWFIDEQIPKKIIVVVPSAEEEESGRPDEWANNFRT